MSRPRDWDAPAYERVAGPVQALGHDLLERLDLRGDETVLDAGCGSGAVTAALPPDDPSEYYRTMILGSHLDRLPDGLRAAFVDRVLAELPDPPTLRYLRLTLSARRPG